MVDTKSLHNTTLLHFLERTVAKHFPDMEEFLTELHAPAEAYRGMYTVFHTDTRIHNFSKVNLQDVRKSLTELRDGLKRIRQELTDNFSDVEQTDRYGTQMWTFVGRATSQLEDLVDDVNHADSLFNEVVKYYGEDERNMSSSEFYGIFKTFVTSYKV